MNKSAIIHLITEFGPTLIFFIAAQMYTFEQAAAILVFATILSLIISLSYEGRVPTLPLIAALVVIASGSITFFYNAPDALIWADTLYYFGIAGAIALGLHRGYLFLKTLFGATFAMYDEGWKILSYRWLYVLIAAGIGNEFVRIFMTPEFWVDYRMVKVGVIFLFALYQFKLSCAYRIPQESNSWGIRTSSLRVEQDKI